MARHIRPNIVQQALAAGMLPKHAQRLCEVYADALTPLAGIARVEYGARPTDALDALAQLRQARPAIADAQAQMLGVLVLAGTTRTAMAHALGVRPATLAALLNGTPAEWVGKTLRRAPDTLGGWAPSPPPTPLH